LIFAQLPGRATPIDPIFYIIHPPAHSAANLDWLRHLPSAPQPPNRAFGYLKQFGELLDG
jgi:hypothetical protein